MLTLLTIFAPAVTNKLKAAGAFKPSNQRRPHRKYDNFGIPVPQSDVAPLFTPGIPHLHMPESSVDGGAYDDLSKVSSSDLYRYFRDEEPTHQVKTVHNKCRMKKSELNAPESYDKECTNNCWIRSGSGHASLDGTCVDFPTHLPVLGQCMSLFKRLGGVRLDSMSQDDKPEIDSIWNYDLSYDDPLYDVD
ncbi:unnamed protein product [Mytilus coruscus]|uniref:Uncharacterized protein n=1 Tax=Mytilus coruscus TaxID=42192 RepID=A0A6J8BVA7_MYTCO|nr:unnamed protein product [Mytilus coruscus]